MNVPKIALVTARGVRDRDKDLPPLEQALCAAGAEVSVLAWDDSRVRWDAYDLVLLRSTWDYVERLPEFLSWARQVSAVTKLLNPLPIIRWNTDKHYLRDLANQGVAIVPSDFIEPDESLAPALDDFLARHAAAECVIKPAVGAGSRDTQRHARADREAMLTHAQRLLSANRSVLLQPYLDRVDVQGETALIFFAGRFSHAIRKGPLLPLNAAATNAFVAPETITPRTPMSAELQVAEHVLAAMAFKTPLYARIDLIRDATDAPCLLELELTEPALFFAHAPGSAERFAAAIMQIAEPLS